jgi:formyltetrahydrofolate synthetase
VERACAINSSCRPFYPLELTIKEKIERIAREIYGAELVSYSADAEHRIETFSKLGYGNLPICMAKTQYSISHDPSLKGAPRGYIFQVNDLRLAAGAGFVYPISGEITTMPGLPSKPGYMGMDIDTETGRITGLS